MMSQRKLHRKRCSFSGALGKRLAAILDLPAAEPKAYGLFATCFTCTKDYRAPVRIGEALARQGIALLRFDYTGLGGSSGSFSHTNFRTNVDDLVQAAAFLRRQFDSPKFLVGLSLGGAAAIVAAKRLAAVQAVVTINTPSHTEHLLEHFKSELPMVETNGAAKVCIYHREFLLTRQLVDDLRRYDLQQEVAALQPALLVMHASRDSTITMDHAHRLFSAATEPKQLVLLDRGDHLLSAREVGEQAGEQIAHWLSTLMKGGR